MLLECKREKQNMIDWEDLTDTDATPTFFTSSYIGPCRFSSLGVLGDPKKN